MTNRPKGTDTDGDAVVAGVLDALPAAAMAVRATTIAHANAAAGTLLGLDPVTLRGVDLLALVSAGDRDLVRDACVKADGVEVHCELSLGDRLLPVAVAVGGPPPGGNEGDLLLAVRSLEAERRSEAILDALAERTMVLDERGLVSWQSAGLAARFASGPDAGIGVNPLERVHPEDLPTVLDAFAQAVDQPGTLVRVLARSRDVDDDDLWQPVEIIGTSEMHDPAIGGIVVQVRELAEGEVVESVGDSDGQFQSLADAAPVGIVVTDAWGRTVYRNAEARALLPRLGQSEDSWRDLVRADRRGDIESMINAAQFDGATEVATIPFELPGGESRHLRVRTSPRFSAGRHSLGVITTFEDVTAEVEARTATERLTQMLDATSDFVAVFRPHGEILYVNAATQGLLDALRADGRDGELRDLIDEEPRRAWIASALEVLETSNVWQGELVLNAGGDRVIPTSALGVVKRAEDGSLQWIAMLARDISALKEAERQALDAATHDHLTGLPNRLLFNDRLDRAVARHKRDRRGVAVMFCDLDGFKEINDGHGHAAGDQVIVTVADRLRAATRETDTPARVGGDEFVVVCEGVTDSDDLATLAERVIDAVAEPIELADGTAVRLGISIGIGVARSRQENVDPDRLLTLADGAMYRAKARGGSGFRIAALAD